MSYSGYSAAAVGGYFSTTGREMGRQSQTNADLYNSTPGPVGHFTRLTAAYHPYDRGDQNPFNQDSDPVQHPIDWAPAPCQATYTPREYYDGDRLPRLDPPGYQAVDDPLRQAGYSPREQEAAVGSVALNGSSLNRMINEFDDVVGDIYASLNHQAGSVDLAVNELNSLAAASHASLYHQAASVPLAPNRLGIPYPLAQPVEPGWIGTLAPQETPGPVPPQPHPANPEGRLVDCPYFNHRLCHLYISPEAARASGQGHNILPLMILSPDEEYTQDSDDNDDDQRMWSTDGDDNDNTFSREDSSSNSDEPSANGSSALQGNKRNHDEFDEVEESPRISGRPGYIIDNITGLERKRLMVDDLRGKDKRSFEENKRRLHIQKRREQKAQAYEAGNEADEEDHAEEDHASEDESEKIPAGYVRDPITCQVRKRILMDDFAGKERRNWLKTKWDNICAKDADEKKRMRELYMDMGWEEGDSELELEVWEEVKSERKRQRAGIHRHLYRMRLLGYGVIGFGRT